MKTKAVYRLISGAVCAVLVMAAASGALAEDIYVADYQGGIIYKISPFGRQTVFASGLNYPNGLVFDSTGNLFEADGGSGNIYEFINQNGVLNSNPVLFASGFETPSGMAFDQMGNLFAADVNGIYQLAPDGTESTFAQGPSQDWVSLAVDRKGDLFAAGPYVAVIEEFTPSGHESAFASALPLWGTTGLAFNKADELYAANYNTNEVMIVKPKHQKTLASTYNPWGMAFDEFGNLYVTDGYGGDVVKINPKGKQETFASGLGDPVTIAIWPLPRHGN